MRGGPAANAGMPVDRADREGGGYVILSINGVPARDQSELSFLISTALADTTVKVEWRPIGGGGSNFTNVKLAKLYMPPERFFATSRRPPVGGLRVDYVSTLARAVNPFHDTIPSGVVIREVQPKSAADRAQLFVDKIITRVNGRPVSSPADFYGAVDAARGAALELTIAGRAEPVHLDPR
jgi:S1-C subfamily serine protease